VPGGGTRDRDRGLQQAPIGVNPSVPKQARFEAARARKVSDRDTHQYDAWPPAADFLAAEERRGRLGCRRSDPESQFTKQQLAAILESVSRSRECKPRECKRSGQAIYARGGLWGFRQARCGGRPRPAIRCDVPISDGPGRRPCWLSPSQLLTPRLVTH
jgi:hypothetical protein